MISSTVTINLSAPDYRRLVGTKATKTSDYIYRKTTAMQALDMARKSMIEQGLTVTLTSANGYITLKGSK